MSDFTDIKGTIVDLTGLVPVRGPEFLINTTSLLGNFLPKVAIDPFTGSSVVVWEAVSGNQGDAVNVRARRYDAEGNPIGDDFRVNTTTANSQGQPDVAFGPGGFSVAVWTGDTADFQNDSTDVFARVYDAEGNPLGDEIPVNTSTAGRQDGPDINFLPQLDAEGRPQFVVSWRDVQINESGDPTDLPIGTGVG